MLSSNDSTSSNYDSLEGTEGEGKRPALSNAPSASSTEVSPTAVSSPADSTSASQTENSSAQVGSQTLHPQSTEHHPAEPQLADSQLADSQRDSTLSQGQSQASQAQATQASRTTHASTASTRSHNRLPTEHRKALDVETREILRFELNSALLHFTQAERSVVLEGFGIVRPIRKKQTRTHHFGDWGIVREETLQTLEFEKCEDTAGLNLDMYARLVDTRELVQSIYSRLPLPLQLRWSERELRRLLIDFIREVRTEVVALGFSDQLRGAGQMFALHNRQGLSPSDWFAGADIFMVPRQTRPLSLGTAQRFSRPVLENAWELWSAVLGPALKTGSIPLSATLKELGFPESVISDYSLSIDSIPFALFLDPVPSAASSEVAGTDPSKKERGAIFVTDGLRSASLTGNPRQKLRHELVIRVPLAVLGRFGMGEAELKHDRSGAPSAVPSFVSCLLAAGALLLASDRMNPLRANAALALGRSITGASDSKLRSLLLTSCSTFGLQQLACDGPFNYATVLGLASDEAALLAARGRDHLFAILESRGLSQTTHPYRSSTLTRGYVELKRDRNVRTTGQGTTSASLSGSSGGASEASAFSRMSRPLSSGQNLSGEASSQIRFSPAALSRSTSFAQSNYAQSSFAQSSFAQSRTPDSAKAPLSKRLATQETRNADIPHSETRRSTDFAQDNHASEEGSAQQDLEPSNTKSSSTTSSSAAAGIPRAD
jgi:hypothetical protein